MNTYKKVCRSIVALTLLIFGISGIAAADEGTGNRYNLPRHYHSEISAAKAYLLITHDRGNIPDDDSANAILIDVRSIEEYKAGHPRRALNIPYPHIQSRPGSEDYIPQSEQDFVAAVIEAMPDLNTPLLTLCRSGYRSVLAGNLLADAGYTNVRNIWEGFEGRWKTDLNGNTLDVNNDGVIGDADKDGWKYYQELPWTTKLHPRLLFGPYSDLY